MALSVEELKKRYYQIVLKKGSAIYSSWERYKTPSKKIVAKANEYAFDKRLKTDALALLKAQEPRVMTLEEVQSCENAMWIELLGGKLSGKGFYAFVLDRMKNGILEISTRAAYLRYNSKDYNAKWRCWTSRPTDEQMEAVKWE